MKPEQINQKKPSSHAVRMATLIITALALLGFSVSWLITEYVAGNGPVKEVALIPGEPWDDMRARSTASIEELDDITDIELIEVDDVASFRFAHPDYGFVTPPAKSIKLLHSSLDQAHAANVTPQLKPLPLEEALKLVLSIQSQLEASGWAIKDEAKRFALLGRHDLVKRPSWEYSPPLEDSPEFRAELIKHSQKSTIWEARRDYQVMLGIFQANYDAPPEERLYLTVLSLSAINK